eukprot:PhF_6_TR25816/c0_g1_i1/m.36442
MSDIFSIITLNGLLSPVRKHDVRALMQNSDKWDEIVMSEYPENGIDNPIVFEGAILRFCRNSGVSLDEVRGNACESLPMICFGVLSHNALRVPAPVLTEFFDRYLFANVVFQNQEGVDYPTYGMSLKQLGIQPAQLLAAVCDWYKASRATTRACTKCSLLERDLHSALHEVAELKAKVLFLEEQRKVTEDSREAFLAANDERTRLSVQKLTWVIVEQEKATLQARFREKENKLIEEHNNLAMILDQREREVALREESVRHLEDSLDELHPDERRKRLATLQGIARELLNRERKVIKAERKFGLVSQKSALLLGDGSAGGAMMSESEREIEALRRELAVTRDQLAKLKSSSPNQSSALNCTLSAPAIKIDVDAL